MRNLLGFSRANVSILPKRRQTPQTCIFENAQLPIASHSSGRVAAVEYHFLAPRMDQLK